MKYITSPFKKRSVFEIVIFLLTTMFIWNYMFEYWGVPQFWFQCLLWNRELSIKIRKNANSKNIFLEITSKALHSMQLVKMCSYQFYKFTRYEAGKIMVIKMATSHRNIIMGWNIIQKSISILESLPQNRSFLILFFVRDIKPRWKL